MSDLPLDQEQLRRVAILVRFGLSLDDACGLSDHDRLRFLTAISEVEWVEPPLPHDAVMTIHAGGHHRSVPQSKVDTYKNYPPVFSHHRSFNAD